jgi:hypothetical protein
VCFQQHTYVVIPADKASKNVLSVSHVHCVGYLLQNWVDGICMWELNYATKNNNDT